MINYELKDKILFKLVNESPNMVFHFDSNQSQTIFECNRNVIRAILDDFENHGLIKQQGFLGGGVMVNILVPAHDLLIHGGFRANEELLTRNIEKLLLEIESLKPSFPDKVEKLTAIASGISSALGLFIR